MPLKGTDYTGFIDLWLTHYPLPLSEHPMGLRYVCLLMCAYEDVWADVLVFAYEFH